MATLAAATVAVSMASWQFRSLVLGRLPAPWRIELSAWKHNVSVDHGVRIRMPDGVTLAASLYRPKGVSDPLPTVLVRLPYGRLQYGEAYESGVFFASHGYAVVVQDLRGTGDSGGQFLPWRDAAKDGEATLDWITRQSWSSGKVGTYGCSALGEVQLALAVRNHPAHAALIAGAAGGIVGTAVNRYSAGLFEGGVLQLAIAVGWFTAHGARNPTAPAAIPYRSDDLLRALPVAGLVARVRPAPNAYSDYLETPLGDPVWREWGLLSDEDETRVPALIINTWGDLTVGDTMALAEQWRARGAPQKVIIAPGTHCSHANGTADNPMRQFGELTIENAERPWSQWYLAWFDYWLRDGGRGLPELANYNVFMLVANDWITSETWPPAAAEAQRWYLGSGGHANSRRGDGWLTRELAVGADQDVFQYDPIRPVPSIGGPLIGTGSSTVTGPADQATVEIRDDVLVYTSDALQEDLRIAGPLRAHLVISSDVPDTDIVARLVHVWPDGRATNIQEGALRLRYREGFSAPVLMKPGQRYAVDVDMRSIAYLLPKGHKLRLHVTSSSFPRLERNLNTGVANNAHETNFRVATTQVHYSSDEAPYLQLYALPVGSGGEERGP